jgi:hypothetical protein
MPLEDLYQGKRSYTSSSSFTYRNIVANRSQCDKGEESRTTEKYFAWCISLEIVIRIFLAINSSYATALVSERFEIFGQKRIELR